MRQQTISFLIFCMFVILIHLPSGGAQSFPEKQVYKVEIAAVSIPAVELTCSSDITALVTIQNTGTLDALVSADIMQDELHVTSISPSIRIFAGEQQTIPLPFSIEKTTQGTYTFDLHLYTEQGIREYIQSFSFAGCKKQQITSLILSSPDTFDMPFMRSSQLQKEEEQPHLSIHATITLLLVSILSLLAGVFLLITYLESRLSNNI